MDRTITTHLLKWKTEAAPKPLLLRGARQVGKTHEIRRLGQDFEYYCEINLEEMPYLKQVFEPDLEPHRIIRDLTLMTKNPIIPGKTLLFIDEIQQAPYAITALRYFYEKIPGLHVAAAGSLLDFALEKIGIPVGRVQFLHMYPMSFIEFLYAIGQAQFVEYLIQYDPAQPFETDLTHAELLKFLAQYLAVGGMPEAVKCWTGLQDLTQCNHIQQALIGTYNQDFNKYAKQSQLKYIELLFNQIPLQLGKKFKYAALHGEYRKRDLAPNIDLLSKAGLIHRIYQSAGNGVPLGAEINLDKFKILFLDIALSQTILGLSKEDWILNPEQSVINKGNIIEAFIGQELLAYSDPYQSHNLYYWQQDAHNSNAELDYLVQKEDKVIPVEVKSHRGNALKSMHLFLKKHDQSPYGIRFSTHKGSIFEKIHSYPLYAVAGALRKFG